MSNYASYANLAKSMTNYGRRMRHLSCRIFNEVARPTNPKSMKVVRLLLRRPIHSNEDITHYYPRHVETHWLSFKLRDYGLFRDEHEDFNDEMKRLRALRGKVPPKKGEGKRAMLKKGE